MKAISRLLIACLLLVSATGFGNTTTDLSQNSKDDVTVSVHTDVAMLSVVVKGSDLLISTVYSGNCNSYVVDSVQLGNQFKVNQFANTIVDPVRVPYRWSNRIYNWQLNLNYTRSTNSTNLKLPDINLGV